MADTSCAKIGPRRLDMDKNHKGRIVSTGGRIVMPAPVDQNNFYLELKKTAGKGKTSVTVCRVGPDGSKSKVWDFIVPQGKSNIGKT